MINLFINSTTFGQALGASFDMNVKGDFAQKRITPDEGILIVEPIYEKTPDQAKIQAFRQAKDFKKAKSHERAAVVETVRVNTLNLLIRELRMLNSLESTDTIIAYLPEELLKEIESGKVKFRLNDPESTNTYYSELELNLWREALPLIQSLYCRIVFKNILACKVNHTGDQIQADRMSIVSSLNARLLLAYREMKAIRAKQATVKEAIF